MSDEKEEKTVLGWPANDDGFVLLKHYGLVKPEDHGFLPPNVEYDDVNSKTISIWILDQCDKSSMTSRHLQNLTYLMNIAYLDHHKAYLFDDIAQGQEWGAHLSAVDYLYRMYSPNSPMEQRRSLIKFPPILNAKLLRLFQLYGMAGDAKRITNVVLKRIRTKDETENDS